MTVFDKHQVKIAKSTLKMSDAGARVMGGMTKDEARKVLVKFFPQSYIDKLEK